MDTSVSLVVELDDISEREEGEIIEGSEEENGLEDVSSSEDEIVLSNHANVESKRRKIDANFKHHIKPDTAQVPDKIRKQESLSDISDLEPEPAFCKKYDSIAGRVHDQFPKFTFHARQSYDKEKLKSIQRTVRRREYTRSRRSSENRSSRVVPQRRSRHRHSRSKTKERIIGDLSSSDTETREDIENKRKLKEALSIDSRNKTALKNRLMNMLGKGKEMVQNPSDTSKPSADNEVIVIDEISSEEDIDLLRLRLLALKSKNGEKLDVPEDDSKEIKDLSMTDDINKSTPTPSDCVPTNNEETPLNSKNSKSVSRDDESESEEVLQLRIQALRSAMIRKHLARKHKLRDDAQTAKNSIDLVSKEDRVDNSCELSTEKDLLDSAIDVPYSPTQSISDIITSEEMSDLVETMSVSDSQVEKLDDLVIISTENMENPKNLQVECTEIPLMDSGQNTEICPALPQETSTPIPKNTKFILNTQKSLVKPRTLPRRKSFTKYASKNNLITATTNNIQQTVIKKTSHIVLNDLSFQNSDTIGNAETSCGKAFDLSTEEDEGILREMLLANINKKQVSENSDMKSLDDDDEDILRAMLLSKLSNKMASTQINAVKNKENTLLIKSDSKIYRTPKSKILKGQIQKKSIIRSPMKLVKKTVTNTKVINKRIAKHLQKPVLKPKDNETNSKPKIPSIIVPKLIINLGADSDTDDENPFKCKSPQKTEIQHTQIKSSGPIEKVVLPERVQDNTNTSQPSSINPDFEKSLDVFLKTARSKVECVAPAKTAVKKIITPPKQIVTPKIVRHMSLSQQNEYRQLLQKMRVLEKRKLAAKKSNNSTTNPVIINKPISKTTKINLLKKNSSLVLKNKEKFANDIKIEIKSNLQSETRKVTNIDKNLNTSTEMKTVCINNDCINVTIANDLVESTNPKDLNKYNPPASIEAVNNLNQVEQNKDADANESEKTPLIQLEKIKDQLRDEKLKELQQQEKLLIQQRMDFITDVENLLKMATKVEIEKGKQTALVNEVAELKERLKCAEAKLDIQNKQTSKLSDSMTQNKKRLALRKRRCIAINYKCMSLGSQISSSYRSPMDGSELMKERVEQLSLKTSKLPKEIPNKLNKKITTNNTVPRIAANVSEVVKKVGIKNEIKKIAESDSLSDETKTKSEHKQKVVSNEGEFIPLSSAEGINSIPGIISKEQAVKFKIADYVSPLDSMEKQSSSDPNAVLCPYELMGRCEDSQCKYKHLSLASDLKSH